MNGYTKKDLSIFEQLIKNKKINEIKSASYNQIEQMTNLSISKIRQTIKKAIKDGFIKEGVKDGHKKRYYITEKGINTIKELS